MQDSNYREKKDSDNESETNDSGFSNVSASTEIDQSITPQNTPKLQDSNPLILPTADFALLSLGSKSENRPETQQGDTTITGPTSKQQGVIMNGNQVGNNLPENENQPEMVNQNGDAQGRHQPNHRNHIGPIHQAISNLPHFDGNPRMLRQFTTSLRHLLNSYGPEHERWILTYIPSRLRGKAYQVFGGTTLLYNTIQEFLEAVKTEFGGIHDMDTIKMELYQVQQDEDELVSEYAERVKDIEQRLLAAYEATVNANEENRNYNNDPVYQRLNRDIVENFLHGLKSPPEHQVAVKNPVNLTEAARIAETLEKKQQFASGHRNVVKTTPAPKQKKRSSSQSRNQAELSESDSEMNQIIELLRDLKYSATVRTTNAIQRENKSDQCKFCKNLGHTLGDCVLLLDAINEKKVNPMDCVPGYNQSERMYRRQEGNSYTRPFENFRNNNNYYSNTNTDQNSIFRPRNNFNDRYNFRNNRFSDQYRSNWNSSRRFDTDNFRGNQNRYNNFTQNDMSNRRTYFSNQRTPIYNTFRDRLNSNQNYPNLFRNNDNQRQNYSNPFRNNDNQRQNIYSNGRTSNTFNNNQDNQNYLNSQRPRPQESPGMNQQSLNKPRN